MARVLGLQEVNTSAHSFEELATSLASLTAYIQSGESLDRPVNDLTLLYSDATRDAPGYAGVNELTGQSLSAVDRRAGRAAWMLAKVERLRVFGVHSLLWHKTKQRFAAPILNQMAMALGVDSALTPDDLQNLGRETWVVDVVGVKSGAIWLVQTLTNGKVEDSALAPPSAPTLFQGPARAFQNPVFEGPSLATLHAGWALMRRAFRRVPVQAYCLVTAPNGLDFEFHRIPLTTQRPERVVLTEDTLQTSSLQPEFREQLEDDAEGLWTLPARLNDDLFRGLPPCRGGRTLCLLALLAKQQRGSEGLLMWTEGEFRKRLRDALNYDIPRDKVRHDLVDRLAAQGFIRKWGNLYHLTMKGMARYLYCLAKYTTLAPDNGMAVLEECVKQRERIMTHCGCL